MAKRTFKLDKTTGRLVDVATGEPMKMPRRKKVTGGILTMKQRAKYPIHSEAMGVNVEDIPKAQEVLRRAGVNTQYDGAGRPILESPSHRKKHCEALGFYDRNGSYGDPQARNR